MYLSIFLRSHDGGNFHGKERFLYKSKREITLASLLSLVRSINCFSKLKETSLTIIDDHSSEETINEMKKILIDCNCENEIINLKETGNSASLKTTYELAMNNGANLIYFVEDDHLHKETAIEFMTNAWEEFTKKIPNGQAVIAPYDDPIDYMSDRISPSRIVVSRDCHWRQNFHTTCTMFISKWILLHFWDKFMSVTNYGINGINEENTINLIYKKEGICLFTPIPALAIHLQDQPNLYKDCYELIEKYFKV